MKRSWNHHLLILFQVRLQMGIHINPMGYHITSQVPIGSIMFSPNRQLRAPVVEPAESRILLAVTTRECLGDLGIFTLW